MKIIRAVSLTLAFLFPVAAIASPAVRAPAQCCMMNSDCCPDCPFCPSGLHK
jgi:hypothetical protein